MRRAAPGLRVAEVKNDTAQAEAGGIFASELRGELAGRGRLDESGPALAVELSSIKTLATTAGTEGGSAFQVQVVLVASAGEWRDTITGGEDYLGGVDVLGTEANRRAALRRLARTLAREAIERYDVAQRLK
ncbi:MAG TPA: LPS assembly lipoprotein LptE [Myxococcales bacterium]|nr:LPS assembly lipoprotein LptE [Myxococcales bacterium]